MGATDTLYGDKELDVTLPDDDDDDDSTDTEWTASGNETNCNDEGRRKHSNCTLTTKYTEQNHRYYLSRYYPHGVGRHFVDLSKDEARRDLKVEKHAQLSSSYKKAFRIPIGFHFPFYGNFVDNIVVTTGGFINIGPRFHSFVHRVHYVAPLMADFNPSRSNKSVVYIGKGEHVVIVQWNDFVLNGRQHMDKTFTFQVALHKNGTVIMAYKDIPVAPSDISVARGDIGVIAGFSDGFIITYTRHDRARLRLVVHNLIYSYHKVNLPLTTIRTGAVYNLTLLPNCITFTTCTGCLQESRRVTNFSCRWCNKLKQCSDSLDWNRQNWLRHCRGAASLRNPAQCAVTKLRKESQHAGPHGGGGNTVGIIIGMFVFVLLCLAAAVFMYAYTHPLSKVGMFLIENRRPWKRFQNNNVDEDYAQLCTPSTPSM